MQAGIEVLTVLSRSIGLSPTGSVQHTQCFNLIICSIGSEMSLTTLAALIYSRCEQVIVASV